MQAVLQHVGGLQGLFASFFSVSSGSQMLLRHPHAPDALHTNTFSYNRHEASYEYCATSVR
jgi:hypothetical protein